MNVRNVNHLIRL